jgi:hypothetical protein
VSLAFACIDEEREVKFGARPAGVNAPGCVGELVFVGMICASDVWIRFVVPG